MVDLYGQTVKQAAGFGGRIILTAAKPNLYDILFYRLSEIGAI